MDFLLARILVGDNPWLEDPMSFGAAARRHLPATYLPRTLEQRLNAEGLTADRATLVVGPRQAGKSTVLWHTVLQADRRTLLVDCEELAMRELARSPAVFLQEMAGFLDRSQALLLEEVQHLDEAGLFIKGLVDRRPGIPILVTGSSAYDLRSRTRESLAGRATRLTLLPLSLDEVSADLDDAPAPIRTLRRSERWQDHVIWGGYPEVWTSRSNRELLLGRLVDAYLMRDASDLFRVARPDAFRKIARLLAGQVGNLVNFAEYASICGISGDTAASYAGILEESHIVRLVPPFAGGKRAEVTSRPKVFFVDNGLRNAFLGAFGPWPERPDRGTLLENWVATELFKAIPYHSTLHYWRSKSGAEVDFVIDHGDEIAGIEVKASQMTRPRLSRSARSFIEAYAPARFLVVNTGLTDTLAIGDTTVQWIQGHELSAWVGSG